MTGAPLLDRVHRALSRSALITRAAIAVRNQCRAVVKHRLMSGAAVGASGEEWLAARLAPRCTTFADAGANVGQWASMFLRYAPPGVRGVLFEPGTAAVAELRRRVARDGIEVVAAALSDRESESAEFFEEPDAGSMSSLTRTAAPAAAVRSSVRITTLDAAMERAGIRAIDFLKIDTEGHDLYVLRGAGELLRRRAIGVLQFEYGDTWASAGATLGAALDLLAQHGYTTCLLKSDGLYRFPYERFGEFFTYANFVAAAEPLELPVKELL